MFSERFEPRSHFKSRSSLTVRVKVVLNRTVVVDSDWRFDNLRGSHLLRVKVSCITLWNSWIRSFGVCFLALMDNRVFLLSMFLAAKRKNIWQFRRQNFHTHKNDSASYAGYKHGSITFSIVLFFNYICCNNKCIYVLPFTCSVKNKRHILDIIQRIWNHLFLPCYIITSLVKHFLHKIH